MARRAFCLHFRAPLHITAEQGVDKESSLDHIPSDTLFGALTITWLEMHKERVEILKLVGDIASADPPFRITSAFPFVGKNLLLPRPRLLVRHEPTKQEQQQADVGLPKSTAKKYKKVRWVSTSLFGKMTDAVNSCTLAQLWKDAHLIQGGAVWLTEDEAGDVQKSLVADDDGHYWISQPDQIPHVVVDRVNNASNLFHVGRVYFAKGCGLWFMAEGEDAWLDRIESALRLLQDSGIGGQRSRGNGQFELEVVDAPALHVSREANCSVLLSRCAPRPIEIDLNRLRDPYASYDLVNVGGYAFGYPIIRRRLRMLSEGSVIGLPTENITLANGTLAKEVTDKKDLLGHFVNVKPESTNPAIQNLHTIWRYGFGFTVPIRQEVQT